ncbi:hypothetical protein DMI69_02195 [Escherichia coli]|nr:hypothetical protein [Escherichia coli]
MVAFWITLPDFDKSLVYCAVYGSKIAFCCIYSQHNCIYTQGRNESVNGRNKRCLISSVITSARQVCRRRVRKSRSVWGSVPQTRLKNI